MSPHFDLQGGWPICAARAVAVGALLSCFGTLIFRQFVAPKAFADMAPDAVAAAGLRMRLLTQASIALAIAGYFVWLLLQAANMADAGDLAATLSAVPKVLGATFFGHVIICQLLVLGVLLALLAVQEHGWQRHASLAAATLAVILQAGHSHAYSMYGAPSLLLGFDVLHLFGAGAWLGGLAPLMLLIHNAPPRAGAVAARWFSPLGKLCILALVVSAGVQGWVLVATIPGLIGTTYGYMVLVKLVLFAMLLGFAAANRYRFSPALLHDRPDAAKRVIVRSILLQSSAAVAIIVAAAVLSDLPPSMHEQATWPFASRFSLAAIDEDPDFHREVVEAALALAGAVCVLLFCVVVRRFRLVAGALVAVVAWFAIPHFDLLLVQAYPTSFYHSPSGFAASGIVEGRAIYAKNCAACHGAGGHGDGPLAKTLPVPPADLTAEHLWMHSDGELFWWLSDGMRTPEGAPAMPGFASILDEDQRWAAIDFIRARNAGDRMAMTGAWTPALHAPGFDAVCGSTSRKLRDMRGKFVLLRFGGSGDAAKVDGAITVVAGTDAKPDQTTDVCITSDETVPAAYAIVAGIDAAKLPGTAFLIDDNGMLRAMQRPGAQSSWNTPMALKMEIDSLRAHPLTDTAAAPMKMPMNMPM